uniref:Uncharacterized protein n=1 Tax=Romanomermis culicivorax TaxID=13658 RepID=A0A915J6A6_ROMCU
MYVTCTFSYLDDSPVYKLNKQTTFLGTYITIHSFHLVAGRAGPEWQLHGWFVLHVAAHSNHTIATMLPTSPPAQPRPTPPPLPTQIILDLD